MTHHITLVATPFERPHAGKWINQPLPAFKTAVTYLFHCNDLRHLIDNWVNVQKCIWLLVL